MLYSKSGLHCIGSMSLENICNFYHLESEYEKKNIGQPWNKE